MKTVEMDENNGLSREEVRSPEPIVITQNSKPVAALVPSAADLDWGPLALSLNPQFAEIIERSRSSCGHVNSDSRDPAIGCIFSICGSGGCPNGHGDCYNWGCDRRRDRASAPTENSPAGSDRLLRTPRNALK